MRAALLCVLVGLIWPRMAAQADIAPECDLPIVMGLAHTSGSGVWSAPPLTAESFEWTDGLFKLKAGVQWQGVLGGLADIEIVELHFHPNPYVLNNILVTNISGISQTYTIAVALPTTFGTPNQILGSITTQVIDGNSNGATISAPAGGSIYEAIIDGFTVATMQDSPFSVVAPVAGVNNALDDFGPDPNAVAVGAFIAIKLSFTLSPGDTASILSRFDVIPEPSSLMLLGAASMLLARRRR